MAFTNSEMVAFVVLKAIGQTLTLFSIWRLFLSFLKESLSGTPHSSDLPSHLLNVGLRLTFPFNVTVISITHYYFHSLFLSFSFQLASSSIH